MQTKSNDAKMTFNGDIGVISALDIGNRSLKVSFDDVDVEHDAADLDELVLAYATTIHKAQGSEYPIIVMPFSMQHFGILQRNLLYTGVTRAKRALVLVGDKEAVGYAATKNQ